MNRTASFDVDRVAREALKKCVAKPDLLKEGFPFVPFGWFIVVEPLEPKEVSDGNIVIVEQSRQAESYQITIARVLKAGPTALQGKTSSGILLSELCDGIQTREQLIGQYVIFQQHTGQSLYLKKTDQRLIVMKTTDLLGMTTDPEAWRFYI